MDKATIDAYNLFAKEYEEETSAFWDRFPSVFLDTFAKLAKGRVLNVGSGPGRDGILLQERGLDVVCLDASNAMVDLSSKKGLKLIVGDFNKLPFGDGEFNGVWAYTSLLHISKQEVGISLLQIKRVLKPGGVLGLGLIEGDTEEYRQNSKVDAPRWFSYYSQLEIEDLLQAHAFESVYFETFKPGSRRYLNFIGKN